MKIISKYKDFYDYLNPDNDPDMTYVRKTDAIYSSKQSEKLDALIEKALGEINNYVPWKRFGVGSDIIMSSVVFGIYPNIYRIPFIYYDNEAYPITAELFETMKQTNEKELEKVIKSYLIKLIAKNNPSEDKLSLFKRAELSYARGVKKNLNDVLKMAECKEIFTEMGSPVFIRLRTRYDSSGESIIGYNNPYNNIISYWENGAKHAYYLKDVVFNMLDLNVISLFHDELININTPINIENFLWSIKQEPESNPDNKTKIEMHGFDVKTSFRKM